MRFLTLLFCLGLHASAFGADLLAREAVIDRARSGIQKLEEIYWSPTLGIWLDQPGDDLRGSYDGSRRPPWWPSANGVELLLDFMQAAGTDEYLDEIATLYTLQKDHRGRTDRVIAELKRRNQWTERDERSLQRRLRREEEAKKAREAAGQPAPTGGHYSDFQNEYLDDSGWWGITWLKMYDRTREEKYLATAKTIHAHMAANWRPDKGGGVIWCEDEDKQRPNAITNNLFLILSARLAKRTGEPSYLEWAEKTLEWIRSSKLYDGIAIVDGPGHVGDYWSYNQGTFIGGLLAMEEATGKQEYLDEAVVFTDGLLTAAGLTAADGSVYEKLGTGGDAGLFKGIFLRYLAQLRDRLAVDGAHPEMAARLEHTIRASAAAALQHGIGKEELFTAEWHKGASDQKADFGTQVSGLLPLTAALPPARAEETD
ncbi:MAG: glycoside hydrolase family 76 protein [Chthoniobacteraceae bacterium]